MLVFIDTEFNGFCGEIISLALVTNTGQDFYEVFETSTKINSWVEENVMPYLEKEPVSKAVVQAKLYQYLMDVSSFGREPLTIIADWPDDIKYFCETLNAGPGNCIATPTKMSFGLDLSLSSSKSRVPHNAYHDAIAIMEDYYEKNPRCC